MASSAIIPCSSSSSLAIRRYDIFVSFCGKDTRNNFTGFLFEALCKNGVDTFKDDAHIKKGESIAPELQQAIEGSRLFIVVFSKNYASSTWCLRELAQICSCVETSPRRVLPIFYDVDPSDVQKQSGSYELAFAEHKEKFREDKEKMEEVQRWREALTQVANLSGWDIQNKPQHAKVQEIVQNIKSMLGPKFSSHNDHLVGMESRLEELRNLLCLESVNDFRVVGISGMGGIGKTTLARALYERISHQYDFHCFIDDVSQVYRDSSILGVQKQLLSNYLNGKNLEICNVSEATYWLWTRLRNVRTLIVFDNVDQVGQLKMFIGSRETLLRECLGGGSRIIIISRDQHILRTLGVNHLYQVQPLNHEDSVQLFCKNAFKVNYIMSDYLELTYGVLSHAQGNPLAIEVLGSSLFGRNVSQWGSALARLRQNKRSIMDELRISFDELDNIDKEIFLDIACCFNNYKEQYVKEILNFRGFHPEYGLEVLVDKSLITIRDGWIVMDHSLVDLGRCIVREESAKNPRKWTRLWDYLDLHKVMFEDMEAENLEVIVLPDQLHDTKMRVDALSKLSHLKFLSLQNVNISGSLKYLSNELMYLTWHGYPFEGLPPSFQPDKLVELFLPNSNINQLWKGKKCLPNLRRVDLSYSKNLIETPNFEDALNLEQLNLEGCIQLRHIDSSIGLLRKLTFVNLKNCRKLVKLPYFGEGLNLQRLNLEGCIQLTQINPSIGHLKKLTILNLKDCKNLVSLPNSILGLNSLKCLSLFGCSKLNNIQLLDEARDVDNLKKSCMGEAPTHSHSIFSFMMWPLHWLFSSTRKDSVTCLVPSSPTFPCMRQFDISFCNLLQIPDAIGDLPCLETLNLSGNNFATLPNLKELRNLFHLNLQHCKQLKDLPELPSQTVLLSNIYMPPWSIIEPLAFGRVAGLYIFNCPELVERERCTSMTISWMIQILQANHQYKRLDSLEYPLLCPSIEIIITGNEIPRWFNNKHVGSLISMDSSPIMKHGNNCIGVVCCVVFAAHRDTGILVAMSPQKAKGVFPVNIPVVLEGDLVTDKLDHLGLFFFTREQYIKTCNFWDTPYSADLKLEFDIRDQQGFPVEVKKCGYRWLTTDVFR